MSRCRYLAKTSRNNIGLQDYVTDILEYIDIEGLSEIILVGHSFSGMICGAVMMTMPGRLRQAIFVDAIIPEEGRSFAEVAGEPFQQLLTKHRCGEGLIKPCHCRFSG